MSRPILIIDSSNLFIRCYCASPQMDQDGNLIGGVTGYLKSLSALVKTLLPKKVYIIWETGGSPRRLKIYPEYKQRRKPLKTNRFYGEAIPDSKDNETYQRQILIKLLQNLPVSQVHVENCEADDIIAYLCKSVFQDEDKIILSSDKDFYQLLNDKTRMYTPGKKVFVREKDVIKEYNIAPKNFVLAKALSGDQSDNIPGVERVGFKTLVKRFEMVEKTVTVDDILLEANTRVSEDKKPLVMYKNIAKSEDLIRRNIELMELNNKLLNIDQIHSVLRIVKEYSPQYDKIKFWKDYLELKLGGLDVDRICNNFHFLTYSK